MKHINSSEIENIEQLEEITGGVVAGVPLKDVGKFYVREDSSLGINDASVPVGCGLEVGDIISVCPETGEVKDVVRFHGKSEDHGLPVIFAGKFLSGAKYGGIQLVKVRSDWM